MTFLARYWITNIACFNHLFEWCLYSIQIGFLLKCPWWHHSDMTAHLQKESMITWHFLSEEKERERAVSYDKEEEQAASLMDSQTYVAVEVLINNRHGHKWCLRPLLTANPLLHLYQFHHFNVFRQWVVLPDLLPEYLIVYMQWVTGWTSPHWLFHCVSWFIQLNLFPLCIRCTFILCMFYLVLLTLIV